jgi:SPX domain protein involved in polyphosphate accumulation
MSYRKEHKFRLTTYEFNEFKNLLLLKGMKPLYSKRQVSSVYYDNNHFKMYHDSEEGVLPRKKIRIRLYNDEKKYTLEKKISSVEGRFKKSETIQSLRCLDSVLKLQPFDRMYGSLYPILLVSYERSYFSIDNLRLTLDMNITYEGLKLQKKLFFSDPERVIEIKVPSDISNDYIEKIIPYSHSRFSKYSRGLQMIRRQLFKY